MNAENSRRFRVSAVNLAAKIREILGTGKLAYLESLKQETPEGILKLAEIGGIGPKKALLLSRELGITDREKLEEAAKSRKDPQPFRDLGRKARRISCRVSTQ